MAASSGGEVIDAEVFTSFSPVVFSDFINDCEFPSYVVITDGNYLSKTVKVSEGDVLLLKSVESKKVTLSYYDDNKNLWTEVCLPLDSDMKFTVLSPKETGGGQEPRARPSSMLVYPTISDLLLDCPTYFEATAPYDDPYLPGLSIRAGDKFRYVRTQEFKGGTLNLEVKDDLDNALVLTSGCRGNFFPLDDPKEYTVRELVDLAPVQRRLKLVNSGKPDDSKGKPTTLCEGVGLEGTRDLSEQFDCVSDNPPSSNVFNDEVSETSSSEDSTPLPFPDKNAQSANFSKESLICDEAANLKIDSLNSSEPILPESGVIHLLPPETSVIVSPYGDSRKTWKIPMSANIRVKPYVLSDYEVPQPNTHSLARPHMPLPVPPLSPGGEIPQYPAPSAPPIPQPLIPLTVDSFADIYSDSLPAKAKLLDISKCNIFFQDALHNTSDLHVYKAEDESRLFVKDYKSDEVYSLSQDLCISFLEYPKKFSLVSELLDLPIGTEVTILEDIASDYPRPISLRFGEVIRICTNTTQYVKMKYANKDCEVLKVEKIDPLDGECMKLKLPTDFEVRMTMSTNSTSPTPVPLKHILWGSAPVPSDAVALLPGEDENQRDLLKNVPSDVVILKAMKQAVLVVAPSGRKHQKPQRHSDPSRSSKQDTRTLSDRLHHDPEDNIGLPVNCSAVLAFQGRLDMSDLDIGQYSTDYRRLPIEKLTMAEFEERERLRKLNSDYEDMGLNGSDSSVNECGTRMETLHRTRSTGQLERRDKRINLDKVRRLSRALNPKHWRQSRQEPEPLPHPSAMGLIALAARPPSGRPNEYQVQQESMEKTNSMQSGSTNTAPSSDEEEPENFYEDVEIGPIKANTLASPLPHSRGEKSGPFSSFLHKSLPSPRRNRRPRNIGKASSPKASGQSEDSVEERGRADRSVNTKTSGQTKEAGDKGNSYDVPKSLDKALRWASKLGDKIQARYDVPKTKVDTTKAGIDERKEEPELCKISLASLDNSPEVNAALPSPPSDRAPSPPLAPPPPRSVSLGISNNVQVSGSNDTAPVAPARRRKPAKTQKAAGDVVKELSESSTEHPPKTVTQTTSTISLGQHKDTGSEAADENDCVKIQPLPRKSLLKPESTTSDVTVRKLEESCKKVAAPKPKPRGLKNQVPTSDGQDKHSPSVSDVIKSIESLAVDNVNNGTAKGRRNSNEIRIPPPIKPRSS